MQQQQNSNQKPSIPNLSGKTPEPAGPVESWTSEYYKAVRAGFMRVWLNKYLWFWGVFLPAAGAGINFGGQSDSENEEFEGNAQEFLGQASNFFFEHIWWFILGALVVLLIIIFFWILSAIARRGVISALDALQSPKGGAIYDFRAVWDAGKKNFFPIMLVDIVIGFSMLFILIVLSTPIVLTFFQGKILGGILLGLLALVIYIPLALLSGFLRQISVIVITLSKVETFKAIEAAYFYIRGNIRESLKLLLTLVLLGVVHGIAGFILVIPFVIVFIGIGLFFVGFSGGNVFSDPFGNPGLMVVAGVVMLFLLVLILLLKAFFALWLQDLWLWWTKKIASVSAQIETEVESLTKETVKKEALTGVNESRAEKTQERVK